MISNPSAISEHYEFSTAHYKLNKNWDKRISGGWESKRRKIFAYSVASTVTDPDLLDLVHLYCCPGCGGVQMSSHPDPRPEDQVIYPMAPRPNAVYPSNPPSRRMAPVVDVAAATALRLAMEVAANDASAAVSFGEVPTSVRDQVAGDTWDFPVLLAAAAFNGGATVGHTYNGFSALVPVLDSTAVPSSDAVWFVERAKLAIARLSKTTGSPGAKKARAALRAQVIAHRTSDRATLVDQLKVALAGRTQAEQQQWEQLWSGRDEARGRAGKLPFKQLEHAIGTVDLSHRASKLSFGNKGDLAALREVYVWAAFEGFAVDVPDAVLKFHTTKFKKYDAKGPQGAVTSTTF